jgi:hypothetical protein
VFRTCYVVMLLLFLPRGDLYSESPMWLYYFYCCCLFALALFGLFPYPDVGWGGFQNLICGYHASVVPAQGFSISKSYYVVLLLLLLLSGCSYSMTDTTLQHYKIFSWNVRDLNSGAKQEDVKHTILTYRLDLMCLQETKLQNVTRSTVQNVLGVDFENNFFLSTSRWHKRKYFAGYQGVCLQFTAARKFSEVYLYSSSRVQQQSDLDHHNCLWTSR